MTYRLTPCFCGNTNPAEFSIKPNKIECFECHTVRTSSTTTTSEEMVAAWNVRGEPMASLTNEQLVLLDQYGMQMRHELTANSGKGDFASWEPKLVDLNSEIDHHLRKLRDAMKIAEESNLPNSRADVTEYAADVGNYMVKAIQMFGKV